MNCFHAAQSRTAVVEWLTDTLPGKNLYELAQSVNVPIKCKGRLNKGWVGQTIERAAGLSINNQQGRDGLDFELKTTSLIPREGRWVPKETIKITQLNPRTILEEQFETSALWNKLSSLILVGCYHESAVDCRTVHISTVNLADPKLVEPIRTFWLDVQNTILTGEMPNYPNLGNSQGLVQLRPTGDGKQWSTCPITGEKFPARAFYATKRLILSLLNQ